MEVNDKKINSKVVSSKNLAQKSSRDLTDNQVKKHNIHVHRELIEVVDKKLSNTNPKAKEASKKLNESINYLNLAESSVTKLDSIVSSIQGLAEQVSSSTISTDRIPKLEYEANELIREVEKEINTAVANFSQEDQIRQKVEDTIGKSLDAILPNAKGSEFNINKIDFSSRESIINVRTNIEIAKDRVNQLKEALNETKSDVSREVARLDIEKTNRQASEASVRDLESALELVSKTVTSINTNPVEALASQSKVNTETASLLK